VVDELDFDAEAFLALPVKERVRTARRLGKRAQQLADKAEPQYRAEYEEIAKHWFHLAAEMERHHPGTDHSGR
jgi:hypothetical protein